MEPRVNKLANELQLLRMNSPENPAISQDSSDGGEFTVDDYECTFADQTLQFPKSERKEKKQKTRRAGVVLIWRDQVAIVKQKSRDYFNNHGSKYSRGNKKYKHEYYNFPKGHARDNEEIRLAAVRELHEETGLVISPNDLGMEFILSNKKLKENCHFFISFLVPSHDKPLLSITGSNGELERAEWIKFEEFRNFTNISSPTKATIKFLDIVKVKVDEKEGQEIKVPLFKCWEPDSSN